jgi:GAF domain-containing protein
MMGSEPEQDLEQAPVCQTPAAVEAVQWFSQAARELQDATDWHDTVQRIVELAAGLARADLAVIIGVSPAGNHPQVLAATDFRRADALLTAQNAAGVFPARQAITGGAPVQVPHLTGHHSWPALQEGGGWPLLRCVVAFPLHIGEEPLASLSMYAQRPGAFNPQVLELAAAFAEHAAVAFNAAAMAEKITNLQVALQHARDIGAAVGIIMQRRHLTQSEAFRQLRIASQHRNVKLYELALATVDTGDLPG